MVKLLAIPVAACFGVLAYVLLGAAAPTPAIPFQDASRVAAGAELYADHCAGCHGAELQGAPLWQYPDVEGYMPAPPLNGSGHTHDHSDLILFQTVKLGPEATVCTNRRSRMGGYAGVLSDEDISSVLAFVKSTWPPESLAKHEHANGRLAVVED
ncbi:MAG: c-type cytochrome [Pseudomonadota bacterium]